MVETIVHFMSFFVISDYFGFQCHYQSADFLNNFFLIFTLNADDVFQNRDISYAEGSPNDKKWCHGECITQPITERLGAGNNNGFDLDTIDNSWHFISIVYFNGSIMKWRISRNHDCWAV